MPAPLTPRQRGQLKARAHSLEPLVKVGHAGVTDAVIAEVDRALTAHGLIKIKIGGLDRDQRAAISETICARTDATAVQRIGKVLALWRPRPDDAALTD